MQDRKQLILDFIRVYSRIHGKSPSYEVIAKAVQLKSKANIHRIVHQLKADGLLTLRPYKFRSIVLVDKSAQDISRL